MKPVTRRTAAFTSRSAPRPSLVALSIAIALPAAPAAATTALADAPLFSSADVPGNMVLALSVEFPTAVTAADRGSFTATKKYLGYFDSSKCYVYTATGAGGAGTGAGAHFYPDGATSGTGYSCSGKWSGNFLNWATMQAVDPFRWALTGGYRAYETDSVTVLEKAYAPSNQGSSGNNFPHKSIGSGTSSVTPFSGNLYLQGSRCGNRIVFRRGSGFSGDNCPTYTDWDGNVTTASQSGNASTTYAMQVRVQVCATATNKEANCVQYGSNYKPEGLIQQYASKIRYSAFGYLNDPTPTGGSMNRDGGVMRARMKFVGPTKPVPGSLPQTNSAAEWSSSTGRFVANPDPSDATASSETGSVVSKSGVINYLNQFGLSAQAYKYYDPVSELYYAATRYLRNKGDVPEFSDLSKYNGSNSSLSDRTSMKDGFPVIRTWDDPILYACQKNFVLGIGDTNTNQDKTVPGNTSYRLNEPASIPSAVTSDNIDAVAATNKVGVLEGMGSGIGNSSNYNSSSNSAYIAGLAYLFNTTDIRTDLSGTQTISTYWLDVLEGSDYKTGASNKNQFYLAAKYGGFTVPSNYSYESNVTALAQNLWSTNGETVSGLGARPDNFFVANQADRMVAGLTNAFASVASKLKSFTTSFSTTSPVVSASGNASFSAQYDAATWSGDIVASTLTLNTSGAPSLTQAWKASDKLAAQLAGTGWDTGRRIATWSGGAVAFRYDNLSASQKSALNTSYRSGDDASDYLNYLRGDRTHEQGSTTTGSSQAYRARSSLLGDIVGSKVRPVGPPSMSLSNASNPGYASFKSTWATRPTVVYVGANDGMMHAFQGDLTGTSAGKELFAYVPSAAIAGPTGAPATDGLAAFGLPGGGHHYYVNATPVVSDIDFGRTVGGSGTDWRSVLIGGMGKGGKSFYAVDVTDPVAMSASEAAVTSKVLWEFTDSTMGYSFGDPVVVRTRQHGWVVVLTSGHNNADGVGYFYIVNPRTGALIQRISTGAGSSSAQAGLVHAAAFVNDRSIGIADAVYAGDLLGNVWRLDLSASSGSYPAPTKIAALTDGTNPQPVTSKPTIAAQAGTLKRFVLVGSGQLLDTSDVSGSQVQSFYALVDGTESAFASTLPGTLSFPYRRSDLALNSNLTTGVTYDVNTQGGWYFDLQSSPSAAAWRVVSDPTNSLGKVIFTATRPNGDVCNPAGTSRVYSLDFGTGLSNLINSSDQVIAYASLSNVVTEMRQLETSGGVKTTTVGTDDGTTQQIRAQPPSAIRSLRRMNWRELPLAD